MSHIFFIIYQLISISFTVQQLTFYNGTIKNEGIGSGVKVGCIILLQLHNGWAGVVVLIIGKVITTNRNVWELTIL